MLDLTAYIPSATEYCVNTVDPMVSINPGYYSTFSGANAAMKGQYAYIDRNNPANMLYVGALNNATQYAASCILNTAPSTVKEVQYLPTNFVLVQ